MNFLGVGPAELVIILVIALVVLGPERMAEAGRTLGRLYARWRSGWGKEVDEVTREFRREIFKLQQEMDEIRREAERPLKEVEAFQREVGKPLNLLKSAKLEPDAPETGPDEAADEAQAAPPQEAAEEPNSSPEDNPG